MSIFARSPNQTQPDASSDHWSARSEQHPVLTRRGVLLPYPVSLITSIDLIRPEQNRDGSTFAFSRLGLHSSLTRNLKPGNCVAFVDHWDNEKSPKSAGVPSRTVPRHACKDRSRRCGHAAGEKSSRPSGLRAGSPPSPPPRLIRLTVRRLPRSPRLSGPGPHCPTTGRYSASAGVISVMVWNSPRNSGRFCAR